MANEIYNEIELLHQCLKGSNDAFGGIVARYQSLVCAITYSATGDTATSEDMAQEAFVNAWKNLAQLKDLSKFRAWLCSIARNVVCNHLRDKKQDVAVRGVPMDSFDNLSHEDSEPVDRMISREQEAVVREALGRIPEEYREPLVLFYREEQSVREVATQLELSEEAVRTRLSRARLMLKNEVEMMIEKTIGRSRPGKAFTTAVMAGIAGIGIGVSGAAAAGVVLAGSGTGIGTGTTLGGSAVMAGLTAKILTAAAVIAVGVAAAYVGYKTVGTRNMQTRPITVDVNVTGSEAKDVRKEINSTKVASSVIGTSSASTTATGMVTNAKLKVRHPNWPEANEPVKEMYAQVTQVMPGGKETIEKYWVRLPAKFRNENEREIIVNDGKKRLTLNLKNITGIAVNGGEKQTLNIKNKTAQLEEQWMKNNKVLWIYEQPLDEHPIFSYVRLFREPNVPAETIIELEEESNDQVQVYQIIERNMPDPNNVFIRAWVDRRSRLPERMEAEVIGDPNKVNGMNDVAVIFDFSPIPDKVFSTDIPGGFDVLPEKAAKTLSGKVVDLNGNGVANAQVWLRNWTTPQMVGPVESDQFGQFTLKMPPNKDGLYYTACLWSRMKTDPRWVGWTVLWSDKEPESNHFERSVGSMGHIRASEKYTSSNGQQGAWCESASDIVIVMEEGAKIYGRVQNSNGKGVGDISIDVSIRGLQHSKPGGMINPYHLCSDGFWTTKTDSEGYYVINDFPTLWNECLLDIKAKPNGKSDLLGESKGVRRLGDMNEPEEISFSLIEKGPIVRGVLKDNYGKPLADRPVSLQMEDRTLLDSFVQTDQDGRFEFKRCPSTGRFMINAELCFNHIPPNEKTKYENFVYYPNTKTEVKIEESKKEYGIELVAIKPEIEIEAILTDSAGNVLPYFPVEVQSDEQIIYGQWQIASNLLQRTDEKGRVKFVKVPELRGLKLIGNRNSPQSDRSQSPEMQQYFGGLVTEYSKFSWAEVPVPLQAGQKHYFMQAVILTQDERNKQ